MQIASDPNENRAAVSEGARRSRSSPPYLAHSQPFCAPTTCRSSRLSGLRKTVGYSLPNSTSMSEQLSTLSACTMRTAWMLTCPSPPWACASTPSTRSPASVDRADRRAQGRHAHGDYPPCSGHACFQHFSYHTRCLRRDLPESLLQMPPRPQPAPDGATDNEFA